jgi:hypothetical protein
VSRPQKFGRSRDKRSKTLISERADGAVRVERQYEIVDNAIGLGSPVTHRAHGWTASSAVDGYMVVEANKNRLLVVDVGPLPSDSRPVLGYRASTAESWFLTRQACEDAAAARPARPTGALESWLE